MAPGKGRGRPRARPARCGPGPSVAALVRVLGQGHGAEHGAALVQGFLPLQLRHRVHDDAGAVGYWAWNGNMDTAIAIRTAVIKNQTLYVQSGGGIVADSDEEAEWQETQNKARAVLRAAQMVQEGLDK